MVNLVGLLLPLFSVSSIAAVALLLSFSAPAVASTSCDARPTQVKQGENKSASNRATETFSAAESDAAVLLLGCDCPSCLNALRQLRHQTLVGAVQGHCWASLTNASPQVIDQVLEAIEAAEASGIDTPLFPQGVPNLE